MTTWQAIVIMLDIVGLIAWLLWLKDNRIRWGYTVAPLSYLLHTLVFYICAVCANLDPQFLNGWSNAVRAHGIILIAGLALILRRFKWTYPS